MATLQWVASNSWSPFLQMYLQPLIFSWLQSLSKLYFNALCMQAHFSGFSFLAALPKINSYICVCHFGNSALELNNFSYKHQDQDFWEETGFDVLFILYIYWAASSTQRLKSWLLRIHHRHQRLSTLLYRLNSDCPTLCVRPYAPCTLKGKAIQQPLHYILVINGKGERRLSQRISKGSSEKNSDGLLPIRWSSWDTQNWNGWVQDLQARFSSIQPNSKKNK